MKIVHTIAQLRGEVAAQKKAGNKVGFVPTMGNLHEGHLSLIDTAKQHAQFIVSSIFVNPMQFGANEDLDAYPRTMARDSELLQLRGCDLLFAPGVDEMYPNGTDAETKVDVPSLGEFHCGASRPGHFVGVATVVTKLFNMVQPDVAVFGEKDYQQLAVIRKMTKDLCMPIEIVGVPTSREQSGLARSSRNGYLSAEEIKQASLLHRVLLDSKNKLENSADTLESVKQDAQAALEEGGFKIDYFNFADPDTLAPSQDGDRELVILVAAWLGQPRLIDNMTVTRNA